MSLLPHSIFRDYESFFDRFWPASQGMAGLCEQTMPLVDIEEKEQVITLKADLPGVNEQDISLEIDGNILSLHAEHTEDNESTEAGKVIRKERKTSSYTRSFTLSDSIQKQDISADFKDGVLTLTLPKISSNSEIGSVQKIAVNK